MKINRRLRTLCAAAVCVFAAALTCVSDIPVRRVTAYASTQSELEEKIKKNEAKIAELDSKIAAIDGDIADSRELQSYWFDKLTATQEQINLLNNKIYAKEEEIAAKQKEIDAKQEEISSVENVVFETERKIEAKELDIRLLQEQNEANVDKFGEIIHSMYISGTDDYMTVLAGAADFYDVYVRSELLDSVGKQNVEFMNSLLDDIHRLEQDKEALEKESENLALDKEKLKYEKDVLDTDRSKLEDDKKVLDEERKKQYDINYSFTLEYNSVTAQIADFEQRQQAYAYQQKVSRSEIEQYEKQIDEIINQAQRAASNTVVYQSGDWLWPVDSRFQYISTYFGYDAWRGGNHGGIDIGNSGIMGANIYAAKSGEVIVAKTSYIPGYDYGMYVVVDHGNGYQTLYAHCSAIYVSVGQMVRQGDVIAAVGSTGWSTGPHLHFEVRINGVRQNPLAYY